MSAQPVTPVIDPAIHALRPDFRAVSLTVTLAGPAVADADAIVAETLARAIGQVQAGGPDWAAAHLDDWRAAFRAFGAKPARTPSSAEALRKRVIRDGALPPAGLVVDLYNAVSLAFAIPVGGEDLEAYRGAPRLIRASGTEPFDVMKDGAPAIETPDPGEVVWCDEAGVTCRRWNWRQGLRTRLTADSRRLWFILEALGSMPDTALAAAGAALADGVTRIWPSAIFVQHTIDQRA